MQDFTAADVFVDTGVWDDMFSQGEGTKVPQKVTYTEERESRRGGSEYKTIYEFEKVTPENIRESIPVLFLRHVMQQAINLDK